MIDFWGVGYQVAKRMGIEDAIRAAGYQIERLRCVGPGGEAKVDVDVDVFRRMIGDEFASLPRGDLAAAVYATIEDKVETIFGDSIATVDQRHDRVHLTFERTAPREFDLVIGADGLHSNVRRLVFGPDKRFEHYLGCKVAACVVDGYRPRDELAYVTYSTPGRQLARFALRGDRTMFLFIFRAEHDSIGVAPKDQLRNQFGDVGWESGDILAALDDVDDLYFDVVSQVRMDDWSRDRVLLIGDAAGCISLLGGEGTGLAMTEAYVLAGELLRAGDRPPSGLRCLRGAPASLHQDQAGQCGEIHLILRDEDPIRLVVTKRGDAHDELRAACNAFCGQCARRLRTARIRHIANWCAAPVRRERPGT